MGKERKDKNSVVWMIRPQIGKKNQIFFLPIIANNK